MRGSLICVALAVASVGSWLRYSNDGPNKAIFRMMEAVDSISDISTVAGKRKLFHLWQWWFAFEEPDEFGRMSPFEAPVFSEEEIAAQLEMDSKPTKTQYPTVVSHGLGDNCFNPGMRGVVKYFAQRLQSYATCVSVGNNVADQTLDGYFVSLENSLEVFRKKIQADPELKGGFHAVGTSQGNMLIRLYMQKYNDPPVQSWLSIHGIITGEQGIPSLDPRFILPRTLADAVGYVARIPLLQKHFMPFGYFRVPAQVNQESYQKNVFIAQFNGEDGSKVPSKLTECRKFVMVQADADLVVWPKEQEHWKMYTDDYQGIVEREDTVFYKQDTFGLRTIHEQKKVFYEHTPGNHCQFRMKDLADWVTKYIIDM